MRRSTGGACWLRDNDGSLAVDGQAEDTFDAVNPTWQELTAYQPP